MATQAFREWLVRHEEDIAAGINDLAELRWEFEAVIGRVARSATEGAVDVPRETVGMPPAAGDPATGEG